ncbi:MSHA biogenesis protein MshL [Sphaerotilus hippei]|uniref:MSHA biogenesis protein MshL n=1 Tax=Sphaerotilus hippei TaxID=744406 RepID=A0A318GZD9_9BURK|nr:secretin N-terminal domain-containing protein [Sphaerotilus hippei]PXW95579.1 MSHA biogenesis protein MshL [Sphaerotilus hippei]
MSPNALKLACMSALLGLGGCALPPTELPRPLDVFRQQDLATSLARAAQPAAPSSTGAPAATGAALATANATARPAAPPSPAGTARPPAADATAPATPAEAAAPARRAAEPRIDLVVNGAPARDVFLALGADSRYNMLPHPELSGTISVTLRGVTLREALDALRDVYGYDYRIDGRRITVFPQTMQTRVFTVNYLPSQRSGRTDIRVSAGVGNQNNGNGSGGSGGSGTSGAGAGQQQQPDSSHISTTSTSDLWKELVDALRQMIGTAQGRSVITSPQAGVIMVRAMPEELRQVEALLQTARLAIERQVMLEAKIVEIELRDGFQSGIDWSVLRGRGSIGQTSGYASNPLVTNGNGLPTLPTDVANALLKDNIALPAATGGLFGLSLAVNGFQAVMGFLESHGETQVLSSPRLATLNNQKAVLKVGTDDYFVTNINGGTTAATSGTTGSSTTTMPSLTLTPFFSGVALDVTPQIDEGNTITLHIHPSVSSVTQVNKPINLGTLGSYNLPLASSSVNETDTVVRVLDGQIVAIGGLMQVESGRSASGLPGSGQNSLTATLLGNRSQTARKKELVVLIKPTIIRSADDWARSTQGILQELSDPQDGPLRRIELGSTGAASPAARAASGQLAAPATTTTPPATATAVR